MCGEKSNFTVQGLLYIVQVYMAWNVLVKKTENSQTYLVRTRYLDSNFVSVLWQAKPQLTKPIERFK